MSSQTCFHSVFSYEIPVPVEYGEDESDGTDERGSAPAHAPGNRIGHDDHDEQDAGESKKYFVKRLHDDSLLSVYVNDSIIITSRRLRHANQFFMDGSLFIISCKVDSIISRSSCRWPSWYEAY